MLPSPDDMSNTNDFKCADVNDLAIVYMFILESGRPDWGRFLAKAEADLVTDFMELRRPVIERLYRDLVSQPVMPWATWNSELKQMLVLWAKRGEVFKYWEQQQKLQTRPIQPPPLPDATRGEWKGVPATFWAREAEAKMQKATKLSRHQMADIEEYNQRYRQFYNLPPWAQVDYDPYLDFKIRFTLTSKLRDAGPMGTTLALTAILKGGTAQDVMAAVDLGNAADGAVAASAPLKGSASRILHGGAHIDGLEPSMGPEPDKVRPAMPLQPFQMKQGYSRQLPPEPRPIYRHTVHGGGMDDILTNQRLLATNSSQFAGASPGVRAYNGPFPRPVKPNKYPHIEFTTKKKPNMRPFFGIMGSEWPMEEGAYLDIEVINVIRPDGTVDPFDAPPREKPAPKLVFRDPPPMKPPVIPAPPRIQPTLPQQPPMPQPKVSPSGPPAPGRKLTTREWVVLEVLRAEWQSVSGLYLQTGIPDAELASMLDGLVAEGYAERQPDPHRPGWMLYRGSPQWIQFKQK